MGMGMEMEMEMEMGMGMGMGMEMEMGMGMVAEFVTMALNSGMAIMSSVIEKGMYSKFSSTTPIKNFEILMSDSIMT